VAMDKDAGVRKEQEQHKVATVVSAVWFKEKMGIRMSWKRSKETMYIVYIHTYIYNMFWLYIYDTLCMYIYICIYIYKSALIFQSNNDFVICFVWHMFFPVKYGPSHLKTPWQSMTWQNRNDHYWPTSAR
jgi:hypothetical protein